MTTPQENVCPFCRRLAEVGREEADVVWEFPHSLVILGTWQYFEGYCVLLARQHVRELFELDPAVRHAFIDEVALVSEALAKLFEPRKLNVEMLGNQVQHLHCHVFPRSIHDASHLKPVWVAIDRADSDAAERRRLERPEVDRRQLRERIQGELTRMTS
jgi:diadenosine tetraphosphate (Ap4A) HIT family hydrolase